uniref:Uncharacterized protein n=1 Tax=Glossina palpalis gambiensis TaxID=67801 RepID=A0A1B0C0K5_9MUSC
MTSVLLSIKSHYRDQIRIGVTLKFLFPLLYLRIGLYVKTTIVLNFEALPEIWDGILKISSFYEQQVSEFCKEDAARVEIIQDLQNRLNGIKLIFHNLMYGFKCLFHVIFVISDFFVLQFISQAKLIKIMTTMTIIRIII